MIIVIIIIITLILPLLLIIIMIIQISAEETMKELSLQKEDTTMKKVIAQMMLMKQIQVQNFILNPEKYLSSNTEGTRKLWNMTLLFHIQSLFFKNILEES